MPVIDSEWRELKAIDRDILTVIAVDGPASGVKIHERIRGEGDVWPSMYQQLERLRENGYLKIVDNPPADAYTHGHENVHALTEAGGRVVNAGVVVPSDEMVLPLGGGTA